MTNRSEPSFDLSPSIWDIAAVSLVDGPQHKPCVQWLADHQRMPATWGALPETNWYDAYLSTYAAATAMHNGGYTDLAEQALQALPALVHTDPGTLETLAFGALVTALDNYRSHRGWRLPSHPAPVRTVAEREQDKWAAMRVWKHFLDPAWSIAGYCAERVFADDTVDAGAFLHAFQVANGSVANSPGASAFLLLELERRTASPAPAGTGKLRHYLHTRRPPSIGYLDWVPHFSLAWAAMFENELGVPPDADPAAVDAMCADLERTAGRLCAVGETTIPGDPDASSCALLAARFLGRTPPPSTGLDSHFDPDQGCYRTYLFEHNASLTTNIHMAAVLALEGRTQRLEQVLAWLTSTMADSPELCKWHVSPTYTLGELARVTARIDHALAPALTTSAVDRLLTTQHPDGGWGVEASTAEETGYAVLGLAAASGTAAGRTQQSDHALRRAHAYLTRHEPTQVPLWLGKNLYCLTPLVPVLHRTALRRIEQLDAV